MDAGTTIIFGPGFLHKKQLACDFETDWIFKHIDGGDLILDTFGRRESYGSGGRGRADNEFHLSLR